ncbi:unnamed protein product [Wuchereria bancrofti]|uniref:Uncharacterized protein n=1 Tax=Wuchereria bancrofti TaxID=6293 RepID=A0A3P7GGP1_WUCBA|nr:unnamed protein product [Wuchereria bancrofti]
MSKKGRNHSQKHQLFKPSIRGKNIHFWGNESDETSDEDNSWYSAKTVNCKTCLKPKYGRYPNKPVVKEIMEIFRKKRPSLENIQRALQLLNVLVDNFQSPADEIHRQSLDVLLVQGIQFQNHTIQYYSIHALSIIVVHMDEDQLKSLIPRGLLTGLTTLLQSEVLFIVQKAIDVCSSLTIKSAAMRDVVAVCGSSHICELLSKHYQTISKEFARVVTTFLQDLCCPKPVPEFVLKYVASSARYLLRHEENEIRTTALRAILNVVTNKDFTLTFEDAYVELIMRFLDSARNNEIRASFNIIKVFAKQNNCNTDAIVKAGLIRKLMSLLQNMSSKYGLDICAVITSLLSNKKYIEPVLESGFVLLLLGLMDRGSSLYKKEAYRALTCMCNNLDRKNARILANRTYLEKMCKIFKSENNSYIACSLGLINCMFKACSKGRAKRRLRIAKEYIRESEAFEHIKEFINSEYYKVRSLADRIYSGYLTDDIH